MKICIIANVGKRDLMWDGKPLPSDMLREKSREIYEDYESQKDRLSAPLLEPAMNLALDGLRDRAQIKMTLIATDQEDPNYREGDTIHCAEVLQKLLKERFSKKASPDINIRKLESAPNRYDEMIKRYMSWAQNNKFQTENADQVYVVCTGGTPACNTALLLAGISVFRHKCKAIYTDEKDKCAYPVGKQVLNLYRKERLDALLQRHDFAGIAADPEQAKEVRNVAAAAAARLNFDFEKMKTDLAPVVEEISLRSFIQSLWVEATELVKDDCERAKKLRELYWNAVLKWESGEYADFLGRVFRLREEALRIGVEKITGIALDSTKENCPQFWDWVKKNCELNDNDCNFLREKIGNKACAQPNTRDFSKVLELYAKKHNDSNLKTLYQTSEWFTGLSNLRNKSIIAHDTRGVSRDQILDTITETEEAMFGQLKRLLECLGAQTGTNPYEEFAAAIRQIDEKVNH